MNIWFLIKLTGKKQYLISILSVIVVSSVCYYLVDLIGYRVVALILLFVVSVCAMFFDILPVLIVALLSALIWDFFFIPPRFTLLISRTEDILMLMMYFTIAMLNGVLTYKKRQWERIARKREEKRTAFKLYNTLLNSLSHELRTPISTIIGATDNLKEHKATLSIADQNALLGEISKASLRLNGNVENLLNMSRLESGVIQPVLEFCDVNEIIRGVKNHLKEYSQNHLIQISVKDDLPLFKLDYGLIFQALYNLVYNATLYTPENSIVTIKAYQEGGNLVITVEDEGKGFHQDEIHKVFQKFYRQSNTKTGGTGLGLSIVKGFIETHNGSIKLVNKQSGGAKFIISLPAEASKTNNLRNE
ncbi:MAG TPA: ATP-binding protein [Bacteroidia bacterium]|nr:ATP-binding protein [Bacteroidia bacterium]